jgi:hypothetical protein
MAISLVPQGGAAGKGFPIRSVRERVIAVERIESSRSAETASGSVGPYPPALDS